MDAVQIITTVLAVLGAVLGVMNAWRNWVHDSVKIKVLFGGATLTTGGEGMSVTVRNLSRFAVTVDSVSFCFSDRRHYPVALMDGCIVVPNTMPVRLEARTSLTIFVPASAVPDEYMTRFTHISADTACGFTFASRRIR